MDHRTDIAGSSATEATIVLFQEGAGKLIVLSEWPNHVEDEEKNKTCLKVFLVGGNKQPVEVVGTFKSGLLGKKLFILLFLFF